MMIYRNTNWTTRNHDCVNVVYQITPSGKAPRRFNGSVPPDGEWAPAMHIPQDMQEIGGFAGYTFYGYL